MSKNLIKSCNELALAFRCGQSIEAVMKLPQLCDDLKALWPELTEQEKPLLVTYLKAILQAQQAQDWLGLADYLDVELAQFLNPNKALP